ncbi:unnamed protein product [Heligmosomoides polygyrus]|uniref:Phlebovirus_G2 domain-containing protein n=1 Tax=Heligmosomoides polygyrus TaxID=6339 RepID=A0A3P7ZL43_HELPZ|nr:unnamed protein product [Heligmosomoides polygyrus]
MIVAETAGGAGRRMERDEDPAGAPSQLAAVAAVSPAITAAAAVRFRMIPLRGISGGLSQGNVARPRVVDRGTKTRTKSDRVLPRDAEGLETICTYNARTFAPEASVEDLMMQARKIKYDVIGITDRDKKTPPLHAAYDSEEELVLGTCDSRGAGGVGVLVNTHWATNIDSYESLTSRIGRLRLNSRTYDNHFLEISFRPRHRMQEARKRECCMVFRGVMEKETSVNEDSRCIENLFTVLSMHAMPDSEHFLTSTSDLHNVRRSNIEHADSTVMEVRLRWINLRLLCDMSSLMYIRNVTQNVTDSKRCTHMGSCQVNKCADLRLLPELALGNNYPVRSGCLESYLGPGFDCFYLSSGFLFYRIYAVPTYEMVFEIYTCTRWKEEVKLQVQIKKPSTKTFKPFAVVFF